MDRALDGRSHAGAGRDRNQDGTGLLQQQLYRAQLEAQLLEMALKSSKHTFTLNFLVVDDFRTPQNVL